MITRYGRSTALGLGIPLVLAALVTGWFFWPAGALIGIVAIWVFSFFRNPTRHIPEGEHRVVAPADGKIVGIDRIEQCPYFDGPAHRVAIFLSIFNVHINRTPLAGTLLKKTITRGKFLNALNPDSSTENENAVTVWQRPDGTKFAVKQISGAIARTIVCEAEVGQSCVRGEAFGMIKFGSRTELFLQAEIPFTATAQVGQNIHAGSTVLGEIA